MRKLLLHIWFLSIGVVFAQSSLNVGLLDNWQNPTLSVNSSGVRYNDCWGFEQDGQEYAILGSTDGTHFFTLTNDHRLKEIDFKKGKYASSMVVHRDFKTYRKYAYGVCDEGNSSLQIFDLSSLPDSISLAAEYTENFIRAHNLFIDTANALMYVSGPVHFDSILNTNIQYKLDVYSLSDPLHPTLVWSGDPLTFPYVHDCYVNNNIAYLNCGEEGLRVYDFSTPTAPVFLQNLTQYQEQGYNHQGWLSPDGKTYIFGDETGGKQLKKCSVNSHQLTIESNFGTNYENGSIPHNIMISNDFAFVAYYNEGLRIYDIRPNTPREIAHYDTYPEESPFKMQGAWGVYSNFPSGRILVSDRHNGLFLFEFEASIFLNTSNEEILVYPNPAAQGEPITMRINLDISSFEVAILDEMGRQITREEIQHQTYYTIPSDIAKGLYILQMKYVNYLDEEVLLHHRFVVH